MGDSTANLINLINIIGSYMEEIELFMISFQDSIGYFSIITIFFVISLLGWAIYLFTKSGKMITTV